MSLYDHHYAPMDTLIRGLVQVRLAEAEEVWTRADLYDVLAVLLPGVRDLGTCWAELDKPLVQLWDLDPRTAAATLRDQGVHGPLNPTDTYDRVRAQIEDEIRAVINAHRTDKETAA